MAKSNAARPWLLLHSKGVERDELERQVEVLSKCWSDRYPLVLSVDDFKERAALLGGWAAWIRSVAQRYGGFILFGSVTSKPTVGKATSEIIHQCGFRDVYLFDESLSAFCPVVSSAHTLCADYARWARIKLSDEYYRCDGGEWTTHAMGEE